MGTLLNVLDFLVLLLLVIQVIRTVSKGQSRDSGSLLLTVCVAVVLIVFATVSFAVYMGLVAVSSSLTQGIFLVILIAMAGIIGVTSKIKAVV